MTSSQPYSSSQPDTVISTSAPYNQSQSPSYASHVSHSLDPSVSTAPNDFYSPAPPTQCFSCHSTEICTDTAQGDVICTSCGVVQHSNICYTGPEWRDYKDNDDGRVVTARCGIVVQDDYGIGNDGSNGGSRWYESVTGISSTVYGAAAYGHGNPERSIKESTYRKRLLRTKRLVDNMIERDHKLQLNDCKLNMDLKRVKRENGCEESTDIDPISSSMIEHEQFILKQEEEKTQSNLALVSDKWSLKRAILLHGTSEEQEDYTDDGSYEIENTKSDMLKRIDSTQRKASSDVYLAYVIARTAMHKLNLVTMNRVVAEVMDRICKFAAVKQGFFVKGVASKVSSLKSKKTNHRHKGVGTHSIDQQRQQNKQKQMGALGSAFIYLVCKKNGLGRTLTEICSSFEYMDIYNGKYTPSKSKRKQEVMIKPKHCSKAMAEIRSLFPRYIQSIAAATATTTTVPSAVSATQVKVEEGYKISPTSYPAISPQEVATTMDFVEHSTRKLKLSPIAIISIQKLVLLSKYRQESLGISSGIKPIKLVASITLLVCDMGAVMQRLAMQACKSEEERLKASNASRKRKRNFGSIFATTEHKQKKALTNTQLSHESELPDATIALSSTDEISIPGELDDTTADTSSEKKKVSVQRSWQEWRKEESWSRPMEKFELTFNVSKATLRECYRKEVYPRRKKFMEELQKMNDPDISIENNSFRHFLEAIEVDMRMKLLLNNVTVAASLMCVPKSK